MPLIDAIRAAADDPETLERLYRNDRKGFARDYGPALDHSGPIYGCWKARLGGGGAGPFALKGRRMWVLVAFCLLSGAIAKAFTWELGYFSQDRQFFSASMTPFAAMLGFTLYQRSWPRKATLVSILLTAVVWGWVVLFPDGWSDTRTLCVLFAPFVLWSAYGVARVGDDLGNLPRRVEYLQFFGEFILVSIILTFCGGVLVLLSVLLLRLLELKSAFAFEYLAVFGGAAVPVVAAWATDRYSAAGRLAPLVAQLFAPLLLIVVVAYMAAAAVNAGTLFTNRNELLTYNVLLLCVLGVAVFSLTGMRGERSSLTARRIILWLLALTTVLDLVGVAAIGWRVWSFGITANRLAVLGSNLAIFGNLLVMARRYFHHLYRGEDLAVAEASLARYLPVYTAWTMAVFFLFPFIFRY
ncbi:MAG: hypothetical protein H0S80_07835 [Desulfovibrionaceae bacterium]|nr:hypothetical protein [Desulfovibrionaceae bacterium]